MRTCQYIESCADTLLEINCSLQPRKEKQHIGALLLVDSFIPSSLLKESRLGQAWSRELPPLQAALPPLQQRVKWLEPCDLHERKPCIQEIIRATQAEFRGMQICSECLKNNTTHTAKCYPPPPPPKSTHTHTHNPTHTCIHNTYPHKKQQPAPWQNSPQVHLHKTLSLTKWLHLTSWVGGRTSPVAAGYLQIPQSFSHQATVSRPPL